MPLGTCHAWSHRRGYPPYPSSCDIFRGFETEIFRPLLSSMCANEFARSTARNESERKKLTLLYLSRENLTGCMWSTKKTAVPPPRASVYILALDFSLEHMARSPRPHHIISCFARIAPLAPQEVAQAPQEDGHVLPDPTIERTGPAFEDDDDNTSAPSGVSSQGTPCFVPDFGSRASVLPPPIIAAMWMVDQPENIYTRHCAPSRMFVGSVS